MRKIPFRFTRNKEKAGAEQQAATSGAASNTATRKEPEPVVGAACESLGAVENDCFGFILDSTYGNKDRAVKPPPGEYFVCGFLTMGKMLLFCITRHFESVWFL
jgi:hypothetical protein